MELDDTVMLKSLYFQPGSDLSLVFADTLSLALGVMPAWCGPEQILFIFNPISARIRTELELGWCGGRWRHLRGDQGAQSDRADGTGAVSRQLPSYTSVPRQFTSFFIVLYPDVRTHVRVLSKNHTVCVQENLLTTDSLSGDKRLSVIIPTNDPDLLSEASVVQSM